MADHGALQSVIEIYKQLGREVAAETGSLGALRAVTTVASRTVPGVDAASITRRRSGVFETLGSTHDIATRADAVQYELDAGPCVDAVKEDHVFRSDDLAGDPRWPQFAAEVSESLGVRSVLSTRLAPLDDDDIMAGLNLYSLQPEAFDDSVREIVSLLATHAGIVVSALVAREKAANLEVALASSRDIGVAMGVLMTRYKISRYDAFDLLRIASQRTHRKLRDIAVEVSYTGTLDLS